MARERYPLGISPPSPERLLATDHCSQLAIHMRENGLLPPTANDPNM